MAKHPRRKLYGAALASWRKAHSHGGRKRRRKGHARKRRNPGAFPMPTALVVNPSRRHMRRRPKRAHNVLVNPRHRRRRRNPGGGIMATVREVGGVAIPAVGAGLALGFVDAKFLSTRSGIVRTGAKVAMAVALGMFGRRFMGDRAVTAGMGAILGTTGYEMGRNLGSGRPMLGDEGSEVEELVPAGGAREQSIEDVYLGVLERPDE